MAPNIGEDFVGWSRPRPNRHHVDVADPSLPEHARFSAPRGG